MTSLHLVNGREPNQPGHKDAGMSNILVGIICPPDWKRRVVIFNDYNVMTTNDIFKSCQRGRTPTSPGLPAGYGRRREAGISNILGDKIIWWVYYTLLIGIGLMVEE